MLPIAIAASAFLVIAAILVPIVSNLKTPTNLHDWYFGNQAAALWISVGIGLLLIWGVYAILYLA